MAGGGVSRVPQAVNMAQAVHWGPRLEGTMRGGLMGWLLVALMFGGGVARAQTADEVVDKTIAALGGRERLGKLTSRHTTGKITVSTPAGDLPGTIDIFNQAPNFVRTLLNID